MRQHILLLILFFFSQEAVSQELIDGTIITYNQHLQIYKSGVLRAHDQLTLGANEDGVTSKRIVKELIITQNKNVASSAMLQYVRIDGKPASAKLRKNSQGTFIEVGNKDDKFTRGFHTFDIVYEVKPEYKVLPNGQERIEWSVVNNDLKEFDSLHQHDYIETAITFPDGLDYVKYNCVADECDVQLQPDLTFFTKLTEGENFSIEMDFAKGTFSQNDETSLLTDSALYLFSAFLIFCTLGYIYVFHRAWVSRFKYRYNTKTSTTPPRGVSPGLVSYLHSGKKITTDTILASIASIANKGYLKITLNEDGSFILTRLKKEYELLSGDEKSMMNSLFHHSNSFHFVDNNETNLFFLLKDYKKALTKELEKVMGKNQLYAACVFPFIIFLIFLISSVLFFDLNFGLAISSEYILILLVAIVMFIIMPSFYLYTKTNRFVKFWAVGPAIFIILMFFTIPLMSVNLEVAEPLLFISLAVFFTFMILIFNLVIKKISENPSILMTKIKSFKEYLNNPELIKKSDSINMYTYDTYFPYSLGLNADRNLTNAFEKHLHDNGIKNYKYTWLKNIDIFNKDLRPILVKALEY